MTSKLGVEVDTLARRLWRADPQTRRLFCEIANVGKPEDTLWTTFEATAGHIIRGNPDSSDTAMVLLSRLEQVPATSAR